MPRGQPPADSGDLQSLPFVRATLNCLNRISIVCRSCGRPSRLLRKESQQLLSTSPRPAWCFSFHPRRVNSHEYHFLEGRQNGQTEHSVHYGQSYVLYSCTQDEHANYPYRVCNAHKDAKVYWKQPAANTNPNSQQHRPYEPVASTLAALSINPNSQQQVKCTTFY
jgi:hypothetical protein